MLYSNLILTRSQQLWNLRGQLQDEKRKNERLEVECEKLKNLTALLMMHRYPVALWFTPNSPPTNSEERLETLAPCSAGGITAGESGVC